MHTTEIQDTCHVVQGKQIMIPSETFVDPPVANGMTSTFGTMGSTFMDAMNIFASAGIRLIPVANSYQHNDSIPASPPRGDRR